MTRAQNFANNCGLTLRKGYGVSAKKPRGYTFFEYEVIDIDAIINAQGEYVDFKTGDKLSLDNFFVKKYQARMECEKRMMDAIFKGSKESKFYIVPTSYGGQLKYKELTPEGVCYLNFSDERGVQVEDDVRSNYLDVLLNLSTEIENPRK